MKRKLIGTHQFIVEPVPVALPLALSPLVSLAALAVAVNLVSSVSPGSGHLCARRRLPVKCVQ